MKIEYMPLFGTWYVEGVGSFKTEEEARTEAVLHENTKSVLLNISPYLHSQIKKLAVKRGVSVSQMMRMMLEKEVKNG